MRCNLNKKYLKIKSGLFKIRLNISWIKKLSKILNFCKNIKDFMILFKLECKDKDKKPI